MIKKDSIDRKEIEKLLPHRAPMLLIDKLTKIVQLKSATAIMNVKKDGFYVCLLYTSPSPRDRG